MLPNSNKYRIHSKKRRRRESESDTQSPTDHQTHLSPKMKSITRISCLSILILLSFTRTDGYSFLDRDSGQEEFNLMTGPKHSVTLRAPRSIGNFFRRVLGRGEKNNQLQSQLPASFSVSLSFTHLSPKPGMNGRSLLSLNQLLFSGRLTDSSYLIYDADLMNPCLTSRISRHPIPIAVPLLFFL